jgi:hypothetical protein
MTNQPKLLMTATVDEIMEAFAAVFGDIFRQHLSQLSKPKEDTFLSRDETRKLLNISLVTLHTWTQQGKLPSYKIAGSSKVYYAEKEVRHLITSSRKTIDHEP